MIHKLLFENLRPSTGGLYSKRNCIFLEETQVHPARIQGEFVASYVENHVNYLHYLENCIGFLNHFGSIIIV